MRYRRRTIWLLGAVITVSVVLQAMILVHANSAADRWIGGAVSLVALLLIAGLLYRLRASSESGARYRRILEAAPDVILLVDTRDRIVGANERLRTVLGHDPVAVEGVPLVEILPDTENIHAMRPGPGQPPSSPFETEARTADGARWAVEIAISHDPEPASTSRWIISLRDARQRQEAEQARQAIEARLHQIIESVPGTVYRCQMDAQWTMSFISPRVQALTGYTADEFINNRTVSFGELILEEDAAGLEEHIRAAAQANRPWLLEYRIRHRDGEPRWVMEHGFAECDSTGQIVWLDGVLMDITEQKRTAAEADEHQRRLVEITESLPGAVWRVEVDKSSGDLRFTQFAGRLNIPFGDMNAEQIIAEPDRFLALIHPDDRERYLADIRQAMTRQEFSSEFRTRRDDNHWGWVRATGSVYGDEDLPYLTAVGHTIDVDDEHRLKHELEAAHQTTRQLAERLGRLTDNIPGTVWEVRADKGGPPRMVYKSATSLLGLSEQENYADILAVRDRIHPDDRPGFDAHFAALQMADDSDALTRQFEFRATNNAGQQRWIKISTRGYVDTDGQRVIYGIATDVHTEKRMEERLHHARQEAERANAAKSEFLANMSHEIRTRMNAIVGMTHLLRSTALTPQQMRQLRQIEMSSHSLLRLLEDILDLSRIESGRLKVEAIAFELHTVIDELGQLMSEHGRNRQLELSLRVAPDCPHRLIGDPLRLGQVLHNLANNAIKFTPDGGSVEVAVHPVWRQSDRVRLRFSVTDTGVGLNEEQQQRVFEAFEQADASTTRRYGGTGLGLPICKRLVELMGGEIGVSSAVGAGSRFWFEITLAEGPARSAPASRMSAAQQRALVVDDHPTACEVLTGLLQRFNIPADSANTCEAALQRLETSVKNDQPYDWLLLDWRLPDRSGTELAQSVRAAPDRYGQPRIVMITGYGTEHSLPGVADLQLDGFMVKPVSPGQLREALWGEGEAPVEDEEYSAASRSLSGLHVLIVEDNAINQEIAATLVRRAGATPLLAGDGRQALKILDAGAEIDVILMDCQMPVLDGYETTRAIRLRESETNTPIIAMTANAMQGDRERCLEAGMNDYLAKPLEPGRLISTIARHVGRPALPQGAEGDAAGLLPALRGFALDDALRRLDGSRSLLLSLLQRFLSDHCGAGQDIRRALDGGDRDAARLHAHSLKGAASSLGAYDLAEQAQALEAAIQAGEPHDALLEHVEKSLHAIRSDLEQQSPPTEQAAGPATSVQIRRQWLRLARLLDEHDTRAVDLARTLNTQLPAELATQAATAFRHIEAYDFPAAREAMTAIVLDDWLEQEGTTA